MTRTIRPTAIRATGIKIDPDRRGFALFLAREAAERTVRDVTAFPRIAVTASRQTDHRTFQLKGAVRAVREGRPEEQSICDDYVARFSGLVEVVGMPRTSSGPGLRA